MELWSLENDLGSLNKMPRWSSRKVVDALDGQIRDAVYKLEVVIESHIFCNIHIHRSQSEEKKFNISFEEVWQEIYWLIRKLQQMRAQYIQELDNPQEVEEEEGEGERDTADFGGKKLDVVGLDGNKLEEIKREITARRVNESGVVSIVGMAGTGRTVIAKAAFENPNNRFYDIRAWITVGPVYELKEIINSLLSQIDGEDDDEDEKSLGEQVYTKLKGRRYLIVLNNVCDTQVWDYLRSLFPSDHNRIWVLLTTGLDEVARSADSFKICIVDFMDEAKSWDCMCDLVFGCPWCPPELEEAGKKIANNCEGRPLEIIKVALLLRGARNTPVLEQDSSRSETK